MPQAADARRVWPVLCEWAKLHPLQQGEASALLGRLQRRWVSPGVGNDRSRAALLLHPGEGSRASKTGEYDETVIVDDPMLARVVARLKPKRAQGEPLIGGDPAEFWALFSVAVARLNVD